MLVENTGRVLMGMIHCTLVTFQYLEKRQYKTCDFMTLRGQLNFPFWIFSLVLHKDYSNCLRPYLFKFVSL